MTDFMWLTRMLLITDTMLLCVLQIYYYYSYLFRVCRNHSFIFAFYAISKYGTTCALCFKYTIYTLLFSLKVASENNLQKLFSDATFSQPIRNEEGAAFIVVDLPTCFHFFVLIYLVHC